MPVPMSPRQRALVLQLLCASVVALLCIQSTSAQVDPTTADATIVDGPIKLYLVAAYGPGLVRPTTGPTLTAKKLNQKKINCQLKSVPGVKARATGVSIASAVAPTLSPQAAPSVLSAAAQAAVAAPVSRTTCRGDLSSGRYNLLASYLEGATFPQWNCYAAAPGDAAAAAALDPALSLPMETQVVNLAAGGSYTCVATYSKAAKDAVTAAAVFDWDAAVETAAAAAAPIGRQECGGLRFTPPKRASWAKPLAPLSVRGNQIIANNAPLQIKGINWFGFNVAMGMVDGLWAGGPDFATDFGKISFELKLLGYNAVRLPFTFNQLANTKVWDLQRDCTALTADQVKRKLIDPNEWNQHSWKTVPGNPAVVGNTAAGKCNDYLPGAKNEDRLLYVLQQFINLGMYVILDYQPMGTEQHAYDLNQFVQGWSALWKRVMCLPSFQSDLAGRIIVDVMNEPDSMGIRWEASGNRPGAQQLYLGTADALWAMSPANSVRFMFEGTGQNNFGLNWGNGFVTDPQVIQSRGLSNPTEFFKYLVKKPYVKYGASIISPHVYPPTITGNTFLGADLWSQCNTAFGYLQAQGFCGQDGVCTQLPVVVGETGSNMKQATDVQWLHDFGDYMAAQGSASQYTRTPVSGWLWWAYNENSGDTEGIVTNQWQDIHWGKIRFMSQKFGLQPWYKLVNRRRKVEDESGALLAGTPEVEVPAAAVIAAETAVAAVELPTATAIEP